MAMNNKSEKRMLEEFNELQTLYRYLSINKKNYVEIYNYMDKSMKISMENEMIIMKRDNEAPVKVKCNAMLLLGIIANLKDENKYDLTECFK